MTPERIQADREIINRATPDIQEPEYCFSYECVTVDAPSNNSGEPLAIFLNRQDGVFFAAARTGWPAALDEIERLQAQILSGVMDSDIMKDFQRVYDGSALERADREIERLEAENKLLKAGVDAEHFAIVENGCVEIYSRKEYLTTPIPIGKECVSQSEITALRKELAESQRRERAAVDDLKHTHYCGVCKDAGCVNEGWLQCPAWEWRGPQD